MSKKQKHRGTDQQPVTLAEISDETLIASGEIASPSTDKTEEELRSHLSGSTRVLIAVPSCEADAELVSACKATWADSVNNDCDIFFFTGELLGVPDGYDDLPIKVQAICKWALERNYDFLFKCDSDTYVFLERLLASGFEAHDYSGYTNPIFPDSQNYCSGGCGYWLSKRAMRVIAEATLPDDTCEDRVVGRLLYDAGIKLHRNPLHAHGRHGEAADHKVLTMHPCRSLELMKAMRDA